MPSPFCKYGPWPVLRRAPAFEERRIEGTRLCGFLVCPEAFGISNCRKFPCSYIPGKFLSSFRSVMLSMTVIS